jgi:hypothetical protein
VTYWVDRFVFQASNLFVSAVEVACEFNTETSTASAVSLRQLYALVECGSVVRDHPLPAPRQIKALASNYPRIGSRKVENNLQLSRIV